MDIRREVLSINVGAQFTRVNFGMQNMMERVTGVLKRSEVSFADDETSLVISDTMRAQIRGLNRAIRNIQCATSLVQTAEAGMTLINDMLGRMNELATELENDLYEYAPNAHNQRQTVRDNLQLEIIQLIQEIDVISRLMQYNGISLFDGTLSRPRPLSFAPSIAGLGNINPTWDITGRYQTNMPETNQINRIITPNPLVSVPDIHIYDLNNGDFGMGWSFNNGVLTIDGDYSFRIVGNGQLTNNRIVVASGTDADIVLQNVNIRAEAGADAGAALDMRGATVNLQLVGNNLLHTYDPRFAAIQTTGGTLVIDGSGHLYARAHGIVAAAIGGGSDGFFGQTGGDITIRGGTIWAVAVGGAGIGGGMGAISGGDGGNIRIEGGEVTAISSQSGAGIGGGGTGAAGGGSGGNITITGGRVTAMGGSTYLGTTPLAGGAGIGGGRGGSGGTVNIEGGIVNATGGHDAASVGGGGGGLGGLGANLTISGGLLEIGAGGWIGGGIGTGNRLNTGITNVNGGNLSIHDPNNIHNDIRHRDNPNPAFRVEVILQDGNGNRVQLGSHVAVQYSINGTIINAITDSQGNLFIYLPEEFEGQQGQMNHGGRTYRGDVEMEANHNNVLVLRLETIAIFRPDGHPLHIQVGANSGDSLFIYVAAMDTRTLGLRDAEGNIVIDFSDENNANFAHFINVLNAAQSYVITEREYMRSMHTRLDIINRNNTNTVEVFAGNYGNILGYDTLSESMREMRRSMRTDTLAFLMGQNGQHTNRVQWLVHELSRVERSDI